MPQFQLALDISKIREGRVSGDEHKLRVMGINVLIFAHIGNNADDFVRL